MKFADHFSSRAREYSQYRPTYPPELFLWLAQLPPSQRQAWDVGTGSGQAAVALAAHFQAVIATDPAVAQLEAASRHARVRYLHAAEQCEAIEHQSLDLVSVAQALHWFDRERFFLECERVLRPGGVLAVWCYELQQIAPQIDREIDWFYRERLGRYWPPERRFVERGYRDFEFPFDPCPAGSFAMQARLTLPRLLGYIGTWSALVRAQAAEGVDPLPELAARLEPIWGPVESQREVRWPLTVIARRKPQRA